MGVHAGRTISDAGYATAAFGKWHLGEVQGRLPTDQGFDEWFGIKNTSDEAGYSSYKLFRERGYPEPQWWEGTKGGPVGRRGLDKRSKDRGDEKIPQRTVAYIRKQAEARRPFFVYVALLQIHPPMGVHPDFAGKSAEGCMRIALPRRIIALVKFLMRSKRRNREQHDRRVQQRQRHEPARRGVNGGSNGPWRGDSSIRRIEGSYRVAAMIRWPGHIAAGQKSQEIFSAVDWLPTLAGLIGESKRVPTDRPIDGINAADYLLGNRKTSGRDASSISASMAG